MQAKGEEAKRGLEERIQDMGLTRTHGINPTEPFITKTCGVMLSVGCKLHLLCISEKK